MEKEEVIVKLEEIFSVACDRYKNNRGTSIADILSIGEILIQAKRNVSNDVAKAERFIEIKMERYHKTNKTDLGLIAKDIAETLKDKL